jgi:hypothetical protein
LPFEVLLQFEFKYRYSGTVFKWTEDFFVNRHYRLAAVLDFNAEFLERHKKEAQSPQKDFYFVTKCIKRRFASGSSQRAKRHCCNITAQ